MSVHDGLIQNKFECLRSLVDSLNELLKSCWLHYPFTAQNESVKVGEYVQDEVVNKLLWALLGVFKPNQDSLRVRAGACGLQNCL